MVSGYAVALAVATPVHGRLADIFGIRAPLCLGLVAMTVGAAAAALAPSFPVLLGARVVQGLGAAAVPVLATALISARLEGDDRGAALVASPDGRRPGLAGPDPRRRGRGAGRVAAGRRHPDPGRGSRCPCSTGSRPPPAATSGWTGPGPRWSRWPPPALVLVLQSPSTGAVVAGIGAALLIAGAPLLARRVRRRPHGFLPRSIVTNRTVLRSSFAAAAVPTSWFAMLLGSRWSPRRGGGPPCRPGCCWCPPRRWGSSPRPSPAACWCGWAPAGRSPSPARPRRPRCWLGPWVPHSARRCCWGPRWSWSASRSGWGSRR
jgi:MFS family permease